jgi:hypothetical protein
MHSRRRRRLLAAVLGAALMVVVAVASVGQASHIRPKGATPIREALVPGYRPCVAPNRTHNPPLALPSCNPPVHTSPNLTTGTADANGLPANMTSAVRLDMLIPAAVGAPDLRIQIGINDQYCLPSFTGPCINTGESLDDFVGGLNVHFDFRITDHFNSVSGGGGTDPATMVDLPIDANVACTAVAGGPPGGQCQVVTSMNALVPGSVPSSRRTVWEVMNLLVEDGGSDGDPATTPNATWLVRGLFQP